MEKTFNPKEAEGRIYNKWEEAGCFKPKPYEEGEETYSIVIPPPNVTGRLHMGHALNHTIQDILCRFERMRGKAVLWQPGTDHAGIATQMVVERKLAAEGNQSRRELGREAFVDKIWEWKEKSGGMILEQDRRLGSSMDWSRERFTMDEGLSAAVQKVFIDLYEKGLIYRGKRLVNWDPHFQTAISDLEVENREVDGHFWHFKYPLEGGETYEYVEKDEEGNVTFREMRDYISIATTRPETMLGDGAVAVHPSDERYAPIVGKMVRLPLADRLIPIITDEYPDKDFGSGAVKITGAHDFNDYEVATRNNIPMYPLMDEQGRMIQTPDKDGNNVMPDKYVGMDRFEARKAVVDDIDAQGLLIQTEDKKIQQPFGDRSGVVIEPMLTDQWFVNAEELAKEAVAAVEDGRTKFVPKNWEKTYFNWMRNIQPWCISRQLWWGHRIPAWYGPDGEIFVADSAEEAAAKAKAHYGKDVELSQDEDVLDTWFSSALWPFSTMGWPEKTSELARFYPTSVLVTAFDIIFFWVARMMMMGLEYKKEIPFHDVYIHSIVRDENGKKMSKSEGNVIDPVDLIDGIGIDALVKKRTTGLRQPEKAPQVEKETRKRYPDGFEAFGADALRFTLAALATKGRDLNLSVDRVAGYRNFGTKLWNAARFAQMNDCRSPAGFDPSSCQLNVNKWAVSAVLKAADGVTEALEDYRFNDAAHVIYQFTWGLFCDWYLELAKPLLQGEDGPEKDETRAAIGWVLDQTLILLHPFMPFITEELWSELASRDSFLMQASWPKIDNALMDEAAEADIDWVIRLISDIRSVRAEMNIPPSAKAPLVIVGADGQTTRRLDENWDLIARLARLEGREAADAAPKAAIQTVLDDVVFALPLAGLIDMEAEIARLDKEIEKTEGEISRIDKKLGNPNFVDRAPEAVVNAERDKRAGYESDLEKLKAARTRLGG